MPGTAFGIRKVEKDPAPTLGGTLYMNGNSIEAAYSTLISPSELYCLNGATSNIQTQLNSKIGSLYEDLSPRLRGNLDLNGYSIIGLVTELSADLTPQLGGDLDTQNHTIDCGADSISGAGATAIASYYVYAQYSNSAIIASAFLGGATPRLTTQAATAFIAGCQVTTDYILAASGASTAIIASQVTDSADHYVSNFASAMIGSLNSNVTASRSVVLGGEDNDLLSGYRNAIITGDNNEIKTGATHDSVILGGAYNDITAAGDRHTIIGGQTNVISTSGHNTAIISSVTSQITGSVSQAAIIAAEDGKASGIGSAILGGYSMAAGYYINCSANGAVAVGATAYNDINVSGFSAGVFASTSSGSLSATGSASVLIGVGGTVTNSGSYSIIAGGGGSTLSTGSRNAIIGGFFNEIKTGATVDSVILGGQYNDITSTGDGNAIIACTDGVISGSASYALAVGSKNAQPLGNYSAVIGSRADYSTIEASGARSLIAATYGSAGGTTEASGDNSVMLGCYQSSSQYSFVSGTSSVAIGTQYARNSASVSAVIAGMNNRLTTGSRNAILGGMNNDIITGATTDSVIIGGKQHDITATGDRNAILAGENNIISSGSLNSAIIGGKNVTINNAAGAGSLATVGYSTSNRVSITGQEAATVACASVDSYFSLTVSGARAAAIGVTPAAGSVTISGSCAVAAGTTGTNFTSNYAFLAGGYYHTHTGSNYSAIVGGSSNTLNGTLNSTIAGGVSCQITGGDANFIGGGSGNTISSSGGYNFIGGGISNTTTSPAARSAIIASQHGKATIPTELVRASGRFTSNGDAQAMHLVARRQVTHSTSGWSALYPLAGTGNHLAIPTDTIWTFEALITGATSGLGKTFGFKVQGCIENDAGTTALKGTPTVTTIDDADDTAFDARASADNTNNALLIQVRDSTSGGDTVRWFAQISISAITYA